MSDFRCSCPHCGQHIQGDEQWQGCAMPCPTCGQMLIVPPGPTALPSALGNSSIIAFAKQFSTMVAPQGITVNVVHPPFTKTDRYPKRLAARAKELGVSEATFYLWKKKYGGMGVTELGRLKQLEDENQRLKNLVADLSLDKHILQEVLAKKV